MCNCLGLPQNWGTPTFEPWSWFLVEGTVVTVVLNKNIQGFMPTPVDRCNPAPVGIGGFIGFIHLSWCEVDFVHSLAPSKKVFGPWHLGLSIQSRNVQSLLSKRPLLETKDVALHFLSSLICWLQTFGSTPGDCFRKISHDCGGPFVLAGLIDLRPLLPPQLGHAAEITRKRKRKLLGTGRESAGRCKNTGNPKARKAPGPFPWYGWPFYGKNLTGFVLVQSYPSSSCLTQKKKPKRDSPASAHTQTKRACGFSVAFCSHAKSFSL